MSTSLYDLSVASFIQVVEATSGVLEKGRVHCTENNIALDDVVATNLHPDMNGFHFQVVCVTHQSIGGIKGLQSGEFSPPSGYADTDYAGLQALTQSTLEELKALDRDEIDSLSGGSVTFKLGKMQIPFSAENFVLSFLNPNLYFHATTAYDILRMQGTPLGKMDFLGNMRMGA